MTAAAVWTIASLISALEGVDPDRERAIEALADTNLRVVETVLDSADWRGRDGAVEALERSEPPRVAALTRVARRHPKITTRRAAIRSLGDVGPAGTCDTLATMLGADSDAVILDAMGERSDCRADVINPFLDAPDPDTRRRAFVVYANHFPAASVVLAARRLDDPDHGVRQAAAAFLAGQGEAGLEAIEGVYARLGRVGRTKALHVAGEAGGAGEPILLEALESEDWVHRRAAAEGLGRRRSATGRRVLRRYLDVERHPLVREAIEWALGADEESDR